MKMVKKVVAVLAVGLLAMAAPVLAAGRAGSVVLTSSNALNNELLVFDEAGALVEAVPTLGQGGVGGNAGGVASTDALVAVVNAGSQDVSVFSRVDGSFVLQQVVPVSSRPVSVAFGKDHLYVLGAATVESHRLAIDAVDPAADGIATLLIGDGSAAQVGVAGEELIVTEKSGVIERVSLRAGGVWGSPVAVDVPVGLGNTPFGLVTRGDTTFVTVAASDAVLVVKGGVVTGSATTGTPGGAGQHSPCWIVVVGPYLFTTNSPSHSVSRLVATGRAVLLDEGIAAQTNGAPIDIDSDGEIVAVLEADPGGVAHLTQFRLAADGTLTRTVSTPIASAANGVVVVSAE
jgi:hypothetical protein